VHVEPGGRLAPLRNDDAVVNDDDCGGVDGVGIGFGGRQLI